MPPDWLAASRLAICSGMLGFVGVRSQPDRDTKGASVGMRVSAAAAAQLVHRHERVIRRRVARGDLTAHKDEQGHWAIDVDDLAAIWRVDPEQLAALQVAAGRTPSGILAQLQAAQASLRVERDARRALEQRMTALERVITRAAGITPEGWQTLARDDTAVASPDGQQAAWEYQSVGEGAALSDLPRSASGDVLASRHGLSHGLSPDARHVLSSYGPERPVALADDGRGDPLRFANKTSAARWLLRHGLNSETTPKSWRGWPPDELTPTGALAFALDVWRDARARGDWRVTWRLHPCDDPQCVCQTLLAE